MSPTASSSRPPSPSASPQNEKSTSPEKAHGHHHPHVHILEKHRNRDEDHAHRRRKRHKFTAGVLEQLGEAIGQVALKDSKFNRAGEIGSLQSARQLARKLFSNLASVHPARHFLLVEDFFPYFKTEQEARTAFMLFDKDDNGDISKKEMREAVQRIYRERKTLVASLKDASSAVAKLDGVMLGVAFLALFFICLLIFNRGSTIESLVPLATLVLGFSFIFGHSAQLLFESLIFIFSTHPYDVGDLVIIDDQPLFVKEFGLFSTVFTRVDGPHIIAPNALLANSKLLHNVRRSGTMWETTNLQIAYDTPLQTIEALKTRLRAFMADNQREWGTPGCEIWIDHMDYQNDIQLIVAIEHRANWQDWGARWARRNKFMKHLKAVLEDLNVGYRQPLQPVSFHPRSLAPPSMSSVASSPSPRGARTSFGQAQADPNSPLMGGAASRVSGRSPLLGAAPPGPSVNAGRYF